MKNYYFKKTLFTSMFVMNILIIPVLVFGNAAAPIMDPVDQSLIFNENTGISLVEETVNFKFKNRDFSKARVEIEYKLKNLTDQEQKLDILFITPNIADADFNAGINGLEAAGIVVNKDIQLPKNWGTGKRKQIIDPISKMPLDKSPSNYYRQHDLINGTTIPITFKPNETLNLYIKYNSESGFYRYQQVINTIYSQLYYLTPAKFWEGECKVNLKIDFTNTGKIELYSNIPMQRVDNYTYSATLDRIPDKEWSFSFVDKKGLIFHTNNLIKHNTYLFLTACLLIVIIKVLNKRFLYSSTSWILYFVVIILTIINIKVTYSFMYSLIFMLPFFLFFIVLIIFLLLTAKINKKFHL